MFMGVAQIMLDDLNLSNIVIGWYKLFGTTSLVSLDFKIFFFSSLIQHLELFLLSLFLNHSHIVQNILRLRQ